MKILLNFSYADYSIEDLKLIHQCVSREGRPGFARNKYQVQKLDLIADKLEENINNYGKDSVHKKRAQLTISMNKEMAESFDHMGDDALVKIIADADVTHYASPIEVIGVTKEEGDE